MSINRFEKKNIIRFYKYHRIYRQLTKYVLEKSFHASTSKKIFTGKKLQEYKIVFIILFGMLK